MFRINGQSIEGDFSQAVREVIGLALDQSISSGTRLKLRVSPGMGTIHTLQGAALDRRLMFREVRLSQLTSGDVLPIRGYCLEQRQSINVPVNPREKLNLPSTGRALVVLSDIEGADPAVVGYFATLSIPGVTFAEVVHDATTPEKEAESLSTTILRKIGFKL